MLRSFRGCASASAHAGKERNGVSRPGEASKAGPGATTSSARGAWGDLQLCGGREGEELTLLNALRLATPPQLAAATARPPSRYASERVGR